MRNLRTLIAAAAMIAAFTPSALSQAKPTVTGYYGENKAAIFLEYTGSMKLTVDTYGGHIGGYYMLTPLIGAEAHCGGLREGGTIDHYYDCLVGPRFAYQLAKFTPFIDIDFGVAKYTKVFNHSGTAFGYGGVLGVDYAVTRKISVRGELKYDRGSVTPTATLGIRQYSIGGVYRFK